MKLPSSVARFTAGIALVGISPIRSSSAQPVVSAAEPPAGSETLQVQWIKVVVPDYGTMLAAVAKPSGVGPFPAVIVLHGSHGFGREYVQLAQALSRGGLLTVAACWFSGRVGGIGSITPIDWPGLPSRPEPGSDAALPAIDALVEAVSALPGARPDRIGVFGHSRGGGMALSYVMSPRKVRSAVLHSTGYPGGEWSERASAVSTPILILHGTADSPADGGSPVTAVQNARDFEAALRRLKKPVETQYYEGGSHNSIFTNSTQFDKEVSLATAFFLRHLGSETDRSTAESKK
jgi:dienelactone hydrolase